MSHVTHADESSRRMSTRHAAHNKQICHTQSRVTPYTAMRHGIHVLAFPRTITHAHTQAHMHTHTHAHTHTHTRTHTRTHKYNTASSLR